MTTTLSCLSSTYRRHQENILASLAHRLEIAQGNHNDSLIQQLERERQQILSSSPAPAPVPSLGERVLSLGRQLVKAWADRQSLQVYHLVNGRDEWWYAIDPQTGQRVYADSAAELRLWIKENYRGR